MTNETTNVDSESGSDPLSTPRDNDSPESGSTPTPPESASADETPDVADAGSPASEDAPIETSSMDAPADADAAPETPPDAPKMVTTKIDLSDLSSLPDGGDDLDGDFDEGADVMEPVIELPPEPPPPPVYETRDWFATTPTDWASWCAFRDHICESVHVRDSFLNWAMNHGDEADQVRLGQGRFAAGELERSIPLLSEASDNISKLLLGHAQRQTGKLAEAVTTWSSISGNDEIAARARTALVDHHLGRRDADALEAAAKAAANDGEAHKSFAEGALAECQGDHQGAIDAWSRTLDADDKHVEATFRLAQLLDLHGDDEAALELYDRFRTGDLPAHIGALMNLGIMHEDNEDHAWALTCFQLVIEADPQNERARRYLNDARASASQYYDESRERSADKQNAVLRIPVTDFELSVRARNCLQRMNIHTLGDLVARSESELLSFKNFGETSLQEVKDILLMKGLRLGMMPPAEAGPTASAAAVAATPGTGDVMEILISELDLSVRSRAALAMLGITKVRELTQTTETTLMSCKNFGQTSLDEIRSKLRNLGLEIAR